jgi:serine protease AprX
MVNLDPLTTTLRPIARSAVLAMLVCAGTVTPAAAQSPHRARLSADLADHLAAGSPTIEVIVDSDQATVDRLARQYNLVVKRTLRRGGAVLTVNAGQLAALQADETVDNLSGNIRYKTSSSPTGQVDAMAEGIGADQVWAGAGNLPKLSGKGVTVAVIDSGFDPKHFALKNRTLLTVDFTGGDGIDRFGHGTHVAAIIAGQAGKTADTQMYQGVASDAYLLNLRVLGNDGSGQAVDVIEAIDWAVDHREQYNIRVINLSLGAPVMQPYRDDPVCKAVERAVRAGIFVVAAAGNNGQTADGRRIMGGIGSPGNSPYAMTVGALDTKGTAERSDDVVAAFSSSGPTRFDLVLKPDLVAPGRRVTSAEAAGSVLSVGFPERHVAGSGPNAYIQGSGTSMATAVVSGAAAVLLEERPGMRPLTTKAALQLTSTFMPEAGLVQAGAGSLNVLAAAEFVLDGNLNATTIAGEQSVASQIVIASANQIVRAHSSGSPLQKRVLFDTVRSLYRNRLSLHRVQFSGTSDTVIWGDSQTVIWGDSDTVIWGDSRTVIWGDSDTVIWGDSRTVIWGDSDTVIWGDSRTVIWGDSDTVIWGDSRTVIWGDSDTVIWGDSQTVIWGDSDTVIWGDSDTVIWGD